MAKFFKWTVEIEVAESMVADGVDLTDARLQFILEKAFPYAYSSEIRSKVIGAPPDEGIATAQGYRSVEEFRAKERKS